MKKKSSVTKKDIKDSLAFTQTKDHIFDKDEGDLTKDSNKKIFKLDLHGLSLIEANSVVKKFILKSYSAGCRKILIVTGKGLRSKVSKNPYISQKFNVLKNSIPEFIKNEDDLKNKISNISTASLKDGGDGAFYIFLKKKKL